MNGIIRAAIVVMILVAAAPSPAEFVYTLDNQPHSTWKGGNSEKPFNWDVPGNWSDNTVPVADTWRNVHFNLDAATAIDYGSKYASDKDNGSFSIIVDAESAPLTITQSDVDLRWYASGRDGTARTSFVNLSPYHAVFNIKVIMYGYRNYDSGIHHIYPSKQSSSSLPETMRRRTTMSTRRLSGQHSAVASPSLSKRGTSSGLRARRHPCP